MVWFTFQISYIADVRDTFNTEQSDSNLYPYSRSRLHNNYYITITQECITLMT